MHLLLFEVALAALAVFGAVCLLRLLVDDWLRRGDTVTTLLYDGSYDASELGCMLRQTRRGFFRAGRVTLTVLPGAELESEVERAIKNENIEIYYVIQK